MKIGAIALNTAREAVRSKILYSVLAFAVLVIAVAALFGSVSLGDQAKFVKDFGLMSITLFGVVVAILMGVGMLHKELGRKTILNVLSKPVARWEFIVGKFAGLLATLAVLVALMSAALIGLLAAWEGRVDWGLLVAAGTTMVELAVVTAAAMLFSSIVVTPTLAGLFTAATFVAGRSAGYLGYFSTEESAPLVRAMARGLYWALPHLDRLNVADQVAYGDPVANAYLATAVVYALGYAAFLMLLTTALFSRREFV